MLSVLEGLFVAKAQLHWLGVQDLRNENRPWSTMKGTKHIHIVSSHAWVAGWLEQSIVGWCSAVSGNSIAESWITAKHGHARSKL